MPRRRRRPGARRSSLFEKGRADAAKIHSEHADDRTALGLLALAERRIAFIDEVLGDRRRGAAPYQRRHRPPVGAGRFRFL